jgi:hypothetical protein
MASPEGERFTTDHGPVWTDCGGGVLECRYLDLVVRLYGKGRRTVVMAGAWSPHEAKLFAEKVMELRFEWKRRAGEGKLVGDLEELFDAEDGEAATGGLRAGRGIEGRDAGHEPEEGEGVVSLPPA